MSETPQDQIVERTIQEFFAELRQEMVFEELLQEFVEMLEPKRGQENEKTISTIDKQEAA